MNFIKPFLLFLLINFSALGIGSRLMGNKATSDWYLSLNKAPWTPEGWVFGAAWTIVMLAFAAYMTFLFNSHVDKTSMWVLFSLQLIFNISWNYIFFDQQLIKLALVVMLSLLSIVTIMGIKYHSTLHLKSVLVGPYLIWLLIATSLNLYIVLKN